jgi:MOSC domain-containing protein
LDWSLRAARFRWAELLRRIFEVDPLTCPRCQGLMRIVAVITEPAVITRILAHRVRARDPTPRLRSPPPRRRRSLTPTGAKRFRVVKPCARCVVTTTDQATGERGHEPLRTLATFRRRDGEVFFGQNVVHEGVGPLRVGEALVR